MGRNYITILFILFASQVFAQCDVLGGLLELQFTTNYDALLRGDGQCLKPTTVTGGLVLTGGELKIIEGDTIGQVLTWDGGGWIPQTIIRDTFFNGLNRSGRNVKLGGTLVQNTTIDGVKTYDFVLSNMRRINFEAERTSGAAYTTMQLGSTDIEGFDLYHISTSSPTNFGYLRVNNTTGNILRLQSATNVQTEVNQYWDGASHVTDIGSTDGVDGKTLRITKTGMFAFSLDKVDEFSSPGIMMYDTFTNEIRYQSPDILLTGGNKPDSTFVRADGTYWGKQTHSAVYRNGATSIHTKDTLGVLNIREKATSNDMNGAAIIQGRTNGDSLNIFMRFKSSDTAATQLIVGATNPGVISPAGRNTSWFYGTNIYPGGSRIDTSRSAMAQVFEENFLNELPLFGNTESAEMHWIFTPKWNPLNKQSRVISAALDHKGRVASLGIQSDIFYIERFGDKFDFRPWDTETWLRANFYNGTFDFGDTISVRMPKNNVGGYWQRRNGGDGAYIRMLMVDSLDRILLGGSGPASMVAAYNHLRITNGGLLTNENGELYFGNTTYPNRSIFENNSANLLTLTRTGSPYTNTLSMFGSQFYFQSSGGGVPLNVDLGAPSNAFVIRGSGLVGLGTFTPAGRLHVNSTSGTSTTKMLTLQNLAGTANFFRSNVEPEGGVSGSPTDVCLTEVTGVGVSLDLKLTGTGNTGWGKMLTNVASTSGTANYIPKYGGANTLQNSIIQESGNNILLPWGGQVRFQFSGSYNVGMRRGSGRNLELFATSPDNDGEVALVPSGGTALTAKHDGKIGIGTTSPAQKLHVEGTARITGSDGTATTITGRDADGDISNVSLSGMAISSGTLALSNSGVTAGTYGEEGAPFEIDVTADGRITSAAAIAYTSATYTSGTTTWQPLDKVVFPDPTSGNVIIEMNGAMHEFVPYILAGGSNLTNTIKIRVTGGGEVFKISGDYGTTTSDYTLSAGQHLTITRVGTTYIVNKN